VTVGVFIRVEADEGRFSPTLARTLVALCPVDIFALDGERLRVRAEQEDECTLCELCLDAAPVGSIVIYKLYSGERLVARSEG
jgi:NAD-dependent dihydropyrimidine dehydrogenase PreA subunit